MQNLLRNPQQLIQSFNQFKNSVQGNPEQIVKNMVSSGQITQKQLNDAQAMAAQIMRIIPK